MRSVIAFAFSVVLPLSSVAQEPPAPPPPVSTPQTQPQTPPAKPQDGDKPAVPPQGGGAPKITPKPPPPSRGPVATKAIEDIDRFRDGQSAPVTRAGLLFDLDLSRVDMNADPLLVLDGKPITRADLDRQICLMIGANEIEQFITGCLMRRVKKEMAAAGQPVPVVDITEADVTQNLEEMKKLRAQMPGAGSPEEFEKQIREVFGWQAYVEFQKQQMEFERFFLPDAPEEWSKKQQAEAKKLDEEAKAKKEAAKKVGDAGGGQGGQGDGTQGEQGGQAGQPPQDKQAAPDPLPVPPADLSFIPAKTWELLDPRFVNQIRDSYARGNGIHPMFRGPLVKSIRTKLLEGVTVRAATPSEPEAVLFVDAESFLIKDLLALVGPRADEHARRIALRELVNLRAADRRLEREGALLNDADSEAGFGEFQKKFANTLIPAEYAVTAFGFNSLWHYRGYFRRKHSYHKLVEREQDDAKLAAYYDKAGRLFFENGTVISQVLFVPGTERAPSKAEMDAALAEVAGGKPFAAVAREKGKFPEAGDVHGGAIAPLIRGKLRQALGETEYTSFLSGYSLADEAFYAAPEDAILGPIWRDMSPKLTGWVALHLDRFFTTGTKPAFTDKNMRERALDDYADVTFPRYVNEELAKVSIELPAKKP